MSEKRTQQPELLKDLPTCTVRGRPARFFLLKLYPVKARVLAVDHPEGRTQLVNKSDLVDIRDHTNSLFAESAESALSPVTQPPYPPQPLPYGILDLDPYRCFRIGAAPGSNATSRGCETFTPTTEPWIQR